MLEKSLRPSLSDQCATELDALISRPLFNKFCVNVDFGELDFAQAHESIEDVAVKKLSDCALRLGKSWQPGWWRVVKAEVGSL